MTKQKLNVGNDLDELHLKIRSWQRWLTFFGAALICSYVIYFGLVLQQSPAQDSDKWGAFGDFFGGILNPIVAFGAFYWLTQSVKLQKIELAETRRELEKSADAQSELVRQGKVTGRIAALTGVIQSTPSAIDIMRARLSAARIELQDAKNTREKEKIDYCQSRVDHFVSRIGEFESLSFNSYKDLAEILKTTEASIDSTTSSPP